MSKEAIMKIREAEAEASRIRAEAEDAARAKIEENAKSCAARAEEGIAATDASLKIKLSSVRERAESLIEQSRQEASEDLESMEAEARSHMREAVKIIVWEMYDSCQ